MSFIDTSKFLRRTAVAFAAAAAFIAGQAGAAQISLSAGGSCTFGTMDVAPTGDLRVQCATTTGTTPNVTLGYPTGNLTAGAAASFTVGRSGINGDVSVSWQAVGTGVCAGSGSVNLTGTAMSAGFTVTPSAAGSCVISLGNPSPAASGVLGSPNAVTATVVAAGGGGGGGGGGGSSGVCAPGQVAPIDNIAMNLGGMGGLDYLALGSGKTASFPVPDPSPGRMMVQLGIGETTSTAAGTLLEWTISKCPGVIDNTLPSPCYNRSYVQNWNSVIIIRDGQGVIDEPMALARRWCYAPAATGPWYMTVRYTYPPAPYPSRFVYQYQNGGY